ncbi:hypothetical protein [Solibacillus sp. FSL K6-1523]|uniref:hypothetical protein n=1 Tax=Solibacillus sp. FSL K6-1523 TaxID=2921471 RepID=UPI0030F9539F
MNKQQEIATFLHEPTEEALDKLWEEDELVVWIDWRECEEDIIGYFNEHLAETFQIECEVIEIDKPRGVDIVLTSTEQSMRIPFADDKTDRDSAIRAMQELIAPHHQIRWFKESLGGDTLAFVLLPTGQWDELEQLFGKEKVQFYFQVITNDCMMFDMSMEEMDAEMQARDQARAENF